MDVIGLMRVWNYDAVTGFTSDSRLVGTYISRLERSLRRLLNDLAVSRIGREKSEGLTGFS